jgi:hypothetical protein
LYESVGCGSCRKNDFAHKSKTINLAGGKKYTQNCDF